MRLKHLVPTTVLISLLTLPMPSRACSLAGCLGNGVEMERDFVVKINHRGKPLAGVAVKVTRYGGEADATISFIGTTGADGTVHVTGLPPAEYWLSSELLGVGAGAQCFHISSHPSRKAKHIVTYEWGDLAPTTRQVVGRLIDPDPGEGATLLQNIRNHVVEPIRGAQLKLQDALSGAVRTTLSDRNGNFTFGDVPSGTYVIHVEGGATPSGREYEPTDVLIRVTDRSTRSTLLLERTMGGAGSCGGPSLILEFPHKTPDLNSR